MTTKEEQVWLTIATVIKMQLTGRDMTQAELAAAVGLGRETMNKYLKGHREIPFLTFLRVADVLNVSPQFIIDEADKARK